MTALAELYTKLLNRPQDLDPLKEVLVTDGAYEALFTAILGHINPGDEVIIIEPYFDCYEPMVRLAGGTPVFISLKPVSLQNMSLIANETGDNNMSPTWKRENFQVNFFKSRPRLMVSSAQQTGSLI